MSYLGVVTEAATKLHLVSGEPARTAWMKPDGTIETKWVPKELLEHYEWFQETDNFKHLLDKVPYIPLDLFNRKGAGRVDIIEELQKEPFHYLYIIPRHEQMTVWWRFTNPSAAVMFKLRFGGE